MDKSKTFSAFSESTVVNKEILSEVLCYDPLSKEIITVDVYGDNRELLVDGVPEIERFISRVIPEKRDNSSVDLSDFRLDISKYLPLND